MKAVLSSIERPQSRSCFVVSGVTAVAPVP
jgi:hypothetical protein